MLFCLPSCFTGHDSQVQEEDTSVKAKQLEDEPATETLFRTASGETSVHIKVFQKVETLITATAASPARVAKQLFSAVDLQRRSGNVPDTPPPGPATPRDAAAGRPDGHHGKLPAPLLVGDALGGAAPASPQQQQAVGTGLATPCPTPHGALDPTLQCIPEDGLECPSVSSSLEPLPGASTGAPPSASPAPAAVEWGIPSPRPSPARPSTAPQQHHGSPGLRRGHGDPHTPVPRASPSGPASMPRPSPPPGASPAQRSGSGTLRQGSGSQPRLLSLGTVMRENQQAWSQAGMGAGARSGSSDASAGRAGSVSARSAPSPYAPSSGGGRPSTAGPGGRPVSPPRDGYVNPFQLTPGSYRSTASSRMALAGAFSRSTNFSYGSVTSSKQDVDFRPRWR